MSTHEHYYTPNPTSEITEKQITYTFQGKQLNFHAVSGVFGFSTHIDKASQLLIESFEPSGPDVLDLGCGFGAIGLALKSNYPESNVTMCDINNRAVAYAKQNASLNNLHVTIVASDLFSEIDEQRFDSIVTNPPIAVGKQFLISLIRESFEHIKTNGSLWLVAFHNKGGATLKKIMLEYFGNAEDISKGGGIRVYRSVKNV